MSRPPFLLCDSDALFQLFLGSEHRPLNILRTKYGVQPVVVPEVEIELRSNRKHGNTTAAARRKVFAHGDLAVLNAQLLATHYKGPAASTQAAATFGQIQTLGAQLHRHLDFGESFTFAAAIVLACPALSHDNSAIQTALTNGLSLPAPILRVFDLLTLCRQVQLLTDHDCDAFRKAMSAIREFVPRCFQNSSFAAGLISYCPRLLDKSVPLIGLANAGTQPHMARLLL